MLLKIMENVRRVAVLGSKTAEVILSRVAVLESEAAEVILPRLAVLEPEIPKVILATAVVVKFRITLTLTRILLLGVSRKMLYMQRRWN